MSPRTSSGQATWPYETVPIRTISNTSEGGRKPQGENHQALDVKGERYPTCGLESESNPGCSSERLLLGTGSVEDLNFLRTTSGTFSLGCLTLSNICGPWTWITIIWPELKVWLKVKYFRLKFWLIFLKKFGGMFFLWGLWYSCWTVPKYRSTSVYTSSI